MHIVIADDGIRFDGRMKEEKPLGGAESAVVGLAEALAARGHKVEVFCRCDRTLSWKGVAWIPLNNNTPALGIPRQADLYIANRAHHLISLCPEAKQAVFWIHNPASYLLKFRYQWPLFWRRPVIVFLGESHLSSYPFWGFDGGRTIIPLGLDPLFRNAEERPTPPPRAVFLSNPLRSLGWLLSVWTEKIFPNVPKAELHIFSGAATYGAMGDRKSSEMEPVLERARQSADKGVILRGPLPKKELAAEICQTRVFLYRGDIGETFCLAAAETQALGLPGVVEDIASMRERIINGHTGFVVNGEQAFADAAIRLLTDDILWRAQHQAALASQRSWGWSEAAEAFEKLCK